MLGQCPARCKCSIIISAALHPASRWGPLLAPPLQGSRKGLLQFAAQWKTKTCTPFLASPRELWSPSPAGSVQATSSGKWQQALELQVTQCSRLPAPPVHLGLIIWEVASCFRVRSPEELHVWMSRKQCQESSFMSKFNLPLNALSARAPFHRSPFFLFLVSFLKPKNKAQINPQHHNPNPPGVRPRSLQLGSEVRARKGGPPKTPTHDCPALSAGQRCAGA